MPSFAEWALPDQDATGSCQGTWSSLLALSYVELRDLAHQLLRGRHWGDTPQTTSLVHEVHLRLMGRGDESYESRVHLLRVAVQAMRCVLVDRARRMGAAKRGAGRQRAPLDETAVPSTRRDPDLIALDEALTRLATLDARKRQIVELRFFGGFTVEETAEVLGISPATVKRDWALAKAWLHGEVCRE